jgi:hypothetical protein
MGSDVRRGRTNRLTTETNLPYVWRLHLLRTKLPDQFDRVFLVFGNFSQNFDSKKFTTTNTIPC